MSSGGSVSDVLGFQPSELMDQVSDAVDKQIDTCVNNIKKELLNSSDAKRKDSALSEDSLERPCKLLKAKLKAEFSKNIDIFDLYASRNIFTLPDEARGGDLGGDESTEELDKEIAETRELSEQLAALRQRHWGLSTEFREAEQMLADMKSSLFGLRVGAQVFEQLSVQPLQDAVSSVVGNKREVLELISKADTLTQQVTNAYEYKMGGSEGAPDSIKAEDARDLQRLLSDV